MASRGTQPKHFSINPRQSTWGSPTLMFSTIAASTVPSKATLMQAIVDFNRAIQIGPPRAEVL